MSHSIIETQRISTAIFITTLDSIIMNYTIIGAGKSGLAAAVLAQENGDTVFLTESKVRTEYLSAAEELDQHGIDHEFGGHTSRALSHADSIIVSPGVPPHAPIIREAEERGIEIMSELEFAWRQITNPIISITGTNGKTTTTALTAFILQQAGKSAIAAGNIGTPLSSLVKSLSKDTIIVLESSSYQLDRTIDFRPNVGVILNITPDHLGYHGSFENYRQAKWKTSSRQTEKDLLILNADDKEAAAASEFSRAQIMPFSINPLQQGAWCDDGRFIIRNSSQHNEEEIMLFDDVRLPGVHNRYNSMAAVLAARAFEVRNENIRDSLIRFAGVEHRLEFVRRFNGVDYSNDSKATNINAAWYALSSYNKPIVWIAGGRGDNNDYSQLDELVHDKVHCIIAIGEDANTIFDHYCLTNRCIKAISLEEAVVIAADIAEPENVVLFSPACKSFDMFNNYEERGECFKRAVLGL
jgi:UDP-N-acetylmuramoylalanine--D-glutamate ligase